MLDSKRMVSVRSHTNFVSCSAVLLGVGLLTGCSGTANSAYVEDFKHAQEANSSDYVRTVFQNAIKAGEIPYSDYKDSRQKFQSCLEKSGITVNVTSDDWGLGLIEIATGAGDEAVLAECQSQFDGIGNDSISVLYQRQVSNPDNENMDKLIAQCLVRKGMAPAGFDAQDYREFIESNSAKCADGICTLQDGTTYPANEAPPSGRTGNYILPGGAHFDTPEGSQCRFAPLADVQDE